MKLINAKPIRTPVQIELNPKEVDVILFALRCVGGNPKGPRALASELISFFRGTLDGQFLLSEMVVKGKGLNSYLPDTWEEAYDK